MSGMEIAILGLRVLDGALMVGQFVGEDKARLEAGADKLRTMLRENRGPNAEERAELNALIDGCLADVIQRHEEAG